MKIKAVKTARKIGNFKLRKENSKRLTIEYVSTLDKSSLRDDSARVYFIVQDGVIKKIGGSTAMGGVRGTLAPYLSGNAGSPGPSRFSINWLIREALLKGSKMEFYVVTSPKSPGMVSGLFDQQKMMVSSFTEMERRCKSEYRAKEGSYPDWNFKEKNAGYPAEIARQHNLYHRKRLKKLGIKKS